MNKHKKIALVGGGTAGHITPNVALIPELKNRGYEIIYIGSKGGMEERIMSKIGIPFFGVTSDKLRRYFDIKNFAMPFNVLKGIKEAREILKKQKVDIIFSKGGFVAVPIVIAGSRLHIPIISHEADITPGLANKIAAPVSKVICCNFEEAAKSFGKKGVHTGSPIRQELLNGDKKKALNFLNFKSEKPIIFVTGGSLGSTYINELIRKNLNKLLYKYNIVHQCGVGKGSQNLPVQTDESLRDILKDGYREFEIISDELPDIFAASDFVISRAGANIIFELLALKKPSLLIPLSKKASRGDQILNANSFEKKNYAVVLTEEDEDNRPWLFLEKIEELENKKSTMIDAMNRAYENDAINKICDIIDKNI